MTQDISDDRPARRPAARAGRRGRQTRDTGSADRKVNYRQLRNPFPPMMLYSEDAITAIHEAALTTLEDLGMKILLPAARQQFRAGGAKVDDAAEMVWIGRDMVASALETAPQSIVCRAARPDRDVLLETDTLVFQPGAGAPHATDLERGRRPGTGRDFKELVRLTQHFDVLHMIPPLIEPQDVPMNLRHYFTMDAQLTMSDKLPFIFSRGTPQVLESFEMLSAFRGLSDADFAAESHSYTIINTNSPRQIDKPMAQGLIDFARYGQVSIVTPFTLMGAMAPITVEAAMTLSHAEALAAITLTQLVNPGAPVCYGTFTSNVDMKSGSPAFGTPEHFRASLLAGQLARLIGLPWRCASGSAANINDVQAANETQFALWGCLMAGSNIVIHAAGWLEGGLTVSYEKLITDIEVLQMVAEMCHQQPPDGPDVSLDALSEVGPGGHFFSADHTMRRYQDAFYAPLVADWSNFGAWTDAGAKTASMRATEIWKTILATEPDLCHDPARIEAMRRFTTARSADGGAAPES